MLVVLAAGELCCQNGAAVRCFFTGSGIGINKKRTRSLNGLAIADELAAEFAQSEAAYRSSVRAQKPRQFLLPQQRSSVPHLHSSSRQFLPQITTLLSLYINSIALSNFSQFNSLCFFSILAKLVLVFRAGEDKKRSGGGECPFCILEKRIARSLSVDLALDAPAKLQNCLKIFAEHFKCGRQEDAHEFLRYVIDACHNTCLRLKKLQLQRRYNNGCKGGENVSNGSSNGCSNSSSGGSSVVKEIFGGALQSQVKCLSCGNESNKVDEIMDISLDVLLSNSLRDAFQKFFQFEVLDGNNKYKCDK